MKSGRLVGLLLPVLFLALVAWFVARENESWKPQLITDEKSGALTLSPDGQWLALSFSSSGLLLNLHDGSQRKIHKCGLLVEFSPDGRYVSSREFKNHKQIIQIFDTTSGGRLGGRTFDSSYSSELTGFAPVRALGNPCDEYISFIDGHLERWKLPDLAFGRPVPIKGDYLRNVDLYASAWENGNRRIMIPGPLDHKNGTLAPVWIKSLDTATGQIELVTVLKSKWEYPHLLHDPLGHGLCWLKEDPRKSTVFDCKTRLPLWSVDTVHDLENSPEGGLILHLDDSDPHRIIVRDTSTGLQLRKTWPVARGLNGPILFAPDGNSIFVRDFDGDIYRVRIR